MNLVVLIGALGKDPELRYTQNQTAVCSFSVATSQKLKDKEKVQWHSVVAWGQLGETCSKYLAKGRKVAVNGRLEYRSWEDKQGQKRISAEVIAESVEFLTPKDQQQGRSEQQFGAHDMPNSDSDWGATPDEGEIPF
jgi:single-strand DNA-binding protein